MSRTVAVANFFIGRGIADQVLDSCAPKVIALTYFAHGWFLGLTGKPLLDRPFIATSTGPDLPELSRLLRPFGNERIDAPLRISTPDPKIPGRSRRGAPIIPTNSPLQVILGKVWAGLGNVGVYTLNDLICAPYSPWASSWYRTDDASRRERPINDEKIQAWFEKRKVRRGARLEISVEAIRSGPDNTQSGGRFSIN